MVRRLLLLFFIVPASTLSLFAQESEVFLKSEHRGREARGAERLFRLQSATSAGQEGFDVTYYRLDLKFTPNSTILTGAVTMVATCLMNDLTLVTLDLMKTMTVDAVFAGGVQVGYVQQATTIVVVLNRPYAAGERFTVVVHYHGVPGSSGFGSFRFSRTDSNAVPPNSPWIWSLSEPYGAKDWWPCKDHPTDKADSVDVLVTCDSQLKVGSVGRLVGVTNNGDGTATYHWAHRYPIATYLVSVAIAPYEEVSGWFKYSPSDSMVVLDYALSSSITKASSSMPQTLSMLRIYSDLFGLYPFITEKYGHAQFGWGGGMEHQTMTSIVNFSENLIAHEMAHQWFGDMITMRTWPHIWLNEGFATYCVALYHERKSGPTGYWGVMNGELSNALRAQGSIYVLDTLNIGRLFSGSLVYSKGAAVLHMLRHVIGDSAFFKALRQYATDHRFMFGTATTEDFRSVCELVSGKSLGYFFNEWIYGEQFPVYRYEWGTQQSGTGYRVRVTVNQTMGSSMPPYFTMPIDFRFKGSAMDTTLSVLNDAQSQTFVFNLPEEPTSFELDPNNWILKDASGVFVSADGGFDTPREYRLLQNYPNPFNPSTVIPFELPASSTVRLEIYNQLGELVRVLVSDQRFEAGRHAIPFEALSVSGVNLPSGVYYARLLVSGAPVQTRKMIHLQ